MRRENKDRMIAACGTALLTGLLLLVLFTGSIGWDRAVLSAVSIPEEQSDEELFIDPELIDLGELETEKTDAPAPSEVGEPEKAETDNREPIERGENPKAAPAVEKKVTQTHESPVKATEPSQSEKERKKVTSKVANSFSGKNGNPDGKPGGKGSGDTQTGVAGCFGIGAWKRQRRDQAQVRTVGAQGALVEEAWIGTDSGHDYVYDHTGVIREVPLSEWRMKRK